MSFVVTGTAQLQCSCGAGPMPLTVLPKQQAEVLLPLAGTVDAAPMANVAPFVMCNSLLNPQVAAATALAAGVLTPVPCVPVPAGTWLPGQPNVLVGGVPALTNDCKLMCAWGGLVQILLPGQMQVQT